MRSTLVLVLAVSAGCEAGRTSATDAPRLTTRWASAHAPDDYVPLSDEESDRLANSVLDTRPQSKVEVSGRRSPGGFSEGVVWVMSSEHPDIENTRGLSLRMIAGALRGTMEAQAKSRGLPVPAANDFTLADRTDDNQIELDWVMRAPGGRTLEHRARMGLRDDGVLIEAICSCSGVGCARERCTFSLPSTGLLPIDTRFEAPRSDDELTVLETQWAWVRVPTAYQPLTIAEESQLPSMTVPGMNVEFASRKHPAGMPDGLVYLRSVDHDPESNYGRTLTEVVEDRRSFRLQEESKLPADERMVYTVHPDADSRVIELHGRQPEASTRRSASRTVFTFLEDGTLREGECFCDARVCSVDDCTLDVGDADRAPIDAPTYPGGTPKSVSVADGAVTFEVPPFLDELPAAEAEEADWVVDRTHLVGAERRCFASDDVALGFACISQRRWCADGACSEADVVGYAKREAEAVASELSTPTARVKPKISQGTRMRTNGAERHSVSEFSAKIGRTIWRRSIVWTDGGVVRERVCTCSGNPCRLMEKTCTIADP